jgi:hypothetical protein
VKRGSVVLGDDATGCDPGDPGRDQNRPVGLGKNVPDGLDSVALGPVRDRRFVKSCLLARWMTASAVSATTAEPIHPVAPVTNMRMALFSFTTLRRRVAAGCGLCG